MDVSAKRQELESLKAQVAKLEDELGAESPATHWQATGYYSTYYATAGFLLGSIAAFTSLVFNVIGASFAGLPPLQLIRVYLTFPLGSRALEVMPGGSKVVVNDGLILAFGCCLYIGTGMLLGIPVYMALAKYASGPREGLGKRLIIASIVSLFIWAVMFYGILSWFQPLVIGGDPGNWITNQNFLPWWVAAATHLVFGWTVALLYPLGQYTPYRRPTETAGA